MIRPLLFLLVFLPAAPAAFCAEPTLEKTVRSRLDALDAHSTLYAKHLESGREIAVRADEPVNTVSVIKLPVMVLAYRDADAGRLGLDERHVIAPEEMRRGTGILQSFAVGLNPTWRDLVTQMIITSDNTATDILIARLGLERVNQMLDALGYKETRLRMTIGQLFRGVWEQTDPKNASLSDRQVFERGFPDDAAAPSRSLTYVADPSKWFGRTTPRQKTRKL
jgi:beta-lactamase class A